MKPITKVNINESMSCCGSADRTVAQCCTKSSNLVAGCHD